MPSDLQKTNANAKLVQKGFYDKETLVLSETYSHTKPSSYGLRPLDPRLADNEHMLGLPNMAVTVDPALLAEIKYN